MKRTSLFLLWVLIPLMLQADTIPLMVGGVPDDYKGKGHKAPARPQFLVFPEANIEKSTSSILIEYRGTDFTELGVCIKDEDGEVVYENQTSETTLQLPLPDSGYYTIEVRVDDTLYVGEFSVEE